jgi:hypothetical protein
MSSAPTEPSRAAVGGPGRRLLVVLAVLLASLGLARAATAAS